MAAPDRSRRSARHRRGLLGGVIAVAAAIGALLPACQSADDPPTASDVEAGAYLERACRMPARWLRLIERGYDDSDAAATDLIAVPDPPNYWGDWTNTAHSGPYGFLQDVPLVFYGPGVVRSQGTLRVRRPVSLANVAATQAQMLRFDLKGREPAIPGVVRPDHKDPKVLVTVVIDGGGWNVLQRWPDAWPNLRRLMGDGTSVTGASVGSSPSVTPAVHTTLGTGLYPKTHGVTAIVVRSPTGDIVGAFSEEPRGATSTIDPSSTLRVPTLADLYDRAHANLPEVALFGFGNYIMGMIGHGSELAGGDEDIAAVALEGEWATDDRYYELPAYVNELSDPQRFKDEVDRRDGRVDGLWLGHELEPLDVTPAFAPWETSTVEDVMLREGFGADRLADLVYINYKTPDAAGHEWNMTSTEVQDAVASVDSGIGDLVRWLDTHVGRGGYVLTVTADHGQTPLGAGGWAIDRGELLTDIAETFLDGGDPEQIVEDTNATGLFLNVDGMEEAGVTPEEVASFMSDYRIGDNTGGRAYPDEFEARRDERIYAAVLPGGRLDEVGRCAWRGKGS